MPPEVNKDRARGQTDWKKLVYDALLILVFPLGVLYLLWRLMAQGKPWRGFAERLGRLPESVKHLAPSEEPLVWVHAVSVGEVAAVEPILRELRRAEPELRIILSTITATGRSLAQRKELELDGLIYFPLDFPGVTERALKAIDPDLVILVETELWPNFLAAAHGRGVPTCVVNGRISDGAFGRYRLVRPLMSWTLQNLDLLCVQSERERERFVALGAVAERMRVTGNSKFDEDFPQVPPEEAAKWRQDLGFGQEQPIFLAASTHPREEELILRCFERLHGRFPDLGLLIAPRHPERGDSVEALIGEFGYACLRRSRTGGPAPPPARGSGDARVQVGLLDTIGELSRVFAIANIVFMGGSLVPVGGHNILQPLALSKPVLFGPYMHNQRDLADLVLQAAAAVSVQDAEELGEKVGGLLGSEPERQLLVARAQGVIEKHTGASRATVNCLLPLLEKL